MLVIMLGGKARVGKTTLAKLISKYAYEKGLSPMIMPFAAVLKEEIESTTGMTKESNPEEYRKACQVLGSKKRKKDPDYWLNLFAKKIEEQRTIDIEKLEANRFGWHEKLIIVDDCRYLNEVGYGRKINALQIFVSHGKRILEEDKASWRKHESESLANSIESNDKNCQEIFHYRTYNDSTLEKFLSKALLLLPEWIEFAKDTKHEGLICSCTSCTARRAGTLLTDSSLAKLIKDIETLKKDWIEEDIDDGTD